MSNKISFNNFRSFNNRNGAKNISNHWFSENFRDGGKLAVSSLQKKKEQEIRKHSMDLRWHNLLQKRETNGSVLYPEVLSSIDSVLPVDWRTVAGPEISRSVQHAAFNVQLRSLYLVKGRLTAWTFKS